MSDAFKKTTIKNAIHTKRKQTNLEIDECHYQMMDSEGETYAKKCYLALEHSTDNDDEVVISVPDEKYRVCDLNCPFFFLLFLF